MAINRAYLSLGSNIKPEHNLRAALELLRRFGRVEKVSAVWQTLPDGAPARAGTPGPTVDSNDQFRAPQPDFLNAAVLLATPYAAADLRTGPLRQIEADLGRVRTADKYASRPIDIDIMLFNADILDLGERHIPDPEIYHRPFVAIPLAELDPEYVHPETGEALHAIAARFEAALSGMRLRVDVSLQGS